MEGPEKYEDRDEYERISRWVFESGGALPEAGEYSRDQAPVADDAAAGRMLTERAPEGATREPYGDDPPKFHGGPHPGGSASYDWPGPEMREKPTRGQIASAEFAEGHDTDTNVEGTA